MQDLPESLPVARAGIGGKLMKALQHSGSSKIQRLWSNVRKAQAAKHQK